VSALDVLGTVVMAAGGALSLLAAIGIVVFPTTLARMHAATKSASLGLALLAIGIGIVAEGWGLFAVGLLLAAFLFGTAPISGHMLGRAAYFAGQTEGLVHDDLAGVDLRPLHVVERAERGFSVPRWLLLLAVWVVFWRDPSVAVLAGGAIVAAIVEMLLTTTPGVTRVRPAAVIVFLVRYFGMVVVSNLRVAREVLNPGHDGIREAIVAAPLSSDSIFVATLVANAITFTPGTLTVELTDDPRVVYVHVLQFSSVEEIHEQVADLERLVSEAFAA
jgi:multicomponent Na+:H+ antiporter subunit E